MSATFKLPDTTPLTGLPVRIESKNSTSDWHAIYSATTGIDGSIKVSAKLGENTSLRVASDGSWQRLASQSASKDFKISRLLSWSAPSSVKAGATYQITGTLQPKSAGTTINLLVDGSNVTSALSDADGKFILPLQINKTGIHSIKLSIDGDSRFSATESKLFGVVAR